MMRFNQEIFLAPGLRTPFGRGGGALAGYDALKLSVPVAKAMAAQLANQRPDLFVWGTVMPNLGWSNIAREIWLDADLDPTVPAYSAILACSTSMTAAFSAAGMLGRGLEVALVGGSEVMSRPSIGLTEAATDRIRALLGSDPTAASYALQSLAVADFVLPTKGWSNRITGRSMGDHMEDTAKEWGIPRQSQDDWAFLSHKRAAKGWEDGFFDDLVIEMPELARDANIRADTSYEKLASLPPAFDKTSGLGTLTAGNSSPITDGAAGLWVVTDAGRAALPESTPFARLLDYEIAAVDHRTDGLLMAPSIAIPRLLDRHGLTFADIALWEIHEAFAAQVLANVAAIQDPDWVADRAGVYRDFGPFPWDRLNPKGGSLAIGHPFGATGARDLSQAVKELAAMPKGAKAIVSVCADGGHGTVALLERA
jgi:acetyl-CoA C-acetyltransferase/acetyl-CoA acyltransferase